ncbi:EcoAI/FtnUII family type I restriction enzme subunit R [Dyella soli]|uniref:DEAD/DEAH box helicase n=1 Tax=Dyella soli TaxID=522319 RepID=A0A4R0YQN4_9GAMM|nr:DEAD/DEAH box helicase family protein [Dyella soli]TCI07151.1 DEAD/DEAH box helicase [Dyella soli]
MNEAETRAELIDPALAAVGWGVVEASRVRREEHITLGRLQGAGQRGKADIADYVLMFRGRKLAVIEAKRRDSGVTEGLAQAKRYANKLQLRFAYATNGHGIYRVDMQTGAEGLVDAWPTPDELWHDAAAEANAWGDRFSQVPTPDKGGSWQLRYYQDIAVTRALEAVASGRERMLLTLATGTGKTSIAFQIAWKLFQARWNLKDRKSGSEPGRRPRILFLADRNTLANQAYNDFSAFAAFAEDALVRISPAEIRKKGAVPTNGNVFFTIFQTFMSGPGNSPYFGDYPADFFDFIIIDECHRGGANDESNWRGILDYFAPAVQLGLTATPKRRANADTYSYFGEPLYSYSLKEGIADGFLTPFKLRQFATTIDDYTYTPDDAVMDGEVVPGKRYTEGEINRVIVIPEREAYRVDLFMAEIGAKEKTLVFCATQEHAALVRDLINQRKTVAHPDYCVRVTAADGAAGEGFLLAFQDNEKIIPTVLTTSQKLSTGVDARGVRNIVLMRPVGSMIEFKQIVGRGTRLLDGKDYFTIFDFVKAYEHFEDPEWDGEPLEPTTGARTANARVEGEDGITATTEEEQDGPLRKTVIRLADGKARKFQHMSSTSYLGVDGKPMSAAQFVESLFGALPDFFKDEDELRAIWSDPTTRKTLLQGLTEKGFGRAQLAEMQKIIEAENSDLFDVLAYVAYTRAPLTRSERAVLAKQGINTSYGSNRQLDFLDFVLSHYVEAGVDELDLDKLTPLLRLKYHAIADAAAELGTPEQIRGVFVGFQKYLYSTSR